MLTIVFNIILIMLATRAVLTAWFHENSIFAAARAFQETRDGFVGNLVKCDICLTYHIVLVFGILTGLSWLIPSPYNHILLLPIYWLAAVSCTHVLNRVLRF